MNKCAKCQSKNIIKAGFARNKQRYLCNICGFQFTTIAKSNAATNTTKALALELYKEGLGFRAIGRSIGFSHVSVQNWIKKEDKFTNINHDKDCQIIEIDEMHTFIGSKKNHCGYGSQLID